MDRAAFRSKLRSHCEQGVCQSTMRIPIESEDEVERV